MALSGRSRFWHALFGGSSANRQPKKSILHEYSEDLQNFIHQCAREPISKEDAKLIDISSLNCTIGLSTAVIPVRLSLQGKLYNLNWLSQLKDFNSEKGFEDPITRHTRYKINILPDRQARQKIQKLISERKKQLPSAENNLPRLKPLPLLSHPFFFPIEIFVRSSQIENMIDTLYQSIDWRHFSFNRIILDIFPDITSKELYMLQTRICDKLNLPKSTLFAPIRMFHQKQIRGFCDEVAKVSLPLSDPNHLEKKTYNYVKI